MTGPLEEATFKLLLQIIGPTYQNFLYCNFQGVFETLTLVVMDLSHCYMHGR